MSKQRHLQSRLISPDYQPPVPFGSLTTPIHHASTVTFRNVEAMRARNGLDEESYAYGLFATPTTYELQHRIAALEGGDYALLAPSGLSAIALINLALLKHGDEVLVPNNVYGPNSEMGRELLAGFGIKSLSYDPSDMAATAALFSEHTRLMWLEAPGSVSMEVPDVPALVALARERGVITALDNTWSAGMFFNGFTHGIDIVMQALTKYPSGGSDVLMGSIVTRDLELHRHLKMARIRLGTGVSGDDAYLVLRGLTSLAARLEVHQKSGIEVAGWLKARREIAQLRHPAFEGAPGHQFWKRDFKGASGLFSVVFDAAIDGLKVDAMVDRLELFSIGYSWGGSHSLVVPYQMEKLRPEQPWRAGALVRFYIGLEHPGDLIADLAQAFEVFGS
jgi:cystathionine beta-lyase